jgi:hypothetical protein
LNDPPSSTVGLYDELPTRWSDEADAATVKTWILGRYGNVKIGCLFGKKLDPRNLLPGGFGFVALAHANQ